MASAFGHGLLGYTISKTSNLKSDSRKLWILAVVSSILPDIDVVGFRLGVPYGDAFGHRGFTHSILFAGIWAVLMTVIFFPRKSWGKGPTSVIFTATLSHGLLDAMTTGGLGVGFFIPFQNGRYFFPFRPIAVSPMGIVSFFDHAVRILGSEFIWIGLPCLGALAFNAFKSRR